MWSLSYKAGKLTQLCFLRLFNWHLVCWSTAMSVQGSVVMTTTGSTSVIKACFLRFFFLDHIRRNRRKMHADWAAEIPFQRKGLPSNCSVQRHQEEPGVQCKPRSTPYSILGSICSADSEETVSHRQLMASVNRSSAWIDLKVTDNLIIHVVCMMNSFSRAASLLSSVVHFHFKWYAKG